MKIVIVTIKQYIGNYLVEPTCDYNKYGFLRSNYRFEQIGTGESFSTSINVIPSHTCFTLYLIKTVFYDLQPIHQWTK